MITTVIQNQFSCAFDILRDAIPSFTDEQWRQGSPAYNGPCRTATHVLLCAEYYVTNAPDIQLRFGKKLWEMSKDELPSQETMLQYLDEVRNKTHLWVGSLKTDLTEADSDKLQPQLEKVIYALRHLQHHIGELCVYQKELGIEPAPWK